MTTRRKMLIATAAGLAAGLGIINTAHAQTLPQVTIETSLGNITIEVDTQNAPNTANNFLQYVESGFYNGTIFHRVISNFMIQGGGFTADMQQKPTKAPIPLEISPALRNNRGTIAMARTNNPNSATSQFFINVVDNPNLNAPNPDGYGYAVFGKVINGMDIVDTIRAVSTGNIKGHQNVPLTPVVIERAYVTNI